jgi:THO complex subunit 5
MDLRSNSSMDIEQPPPADTVLDDLRALATNGTESSPSTTLFVQLKGLNRAANTAARAHKAAAASARSEMDKTQFDLQNLLYEKRHLEREIEKCRQFA